MSIANGVEFDEADNVVELVNPNHIYTWYEPNFHAIKVGMGRDPNGRMIDYAGGYQFTGRHLHSIPVSPLLNVRGIEAKCHDALLRAGLKCMPGPSREVFALGTRLTYEAAVEIVETVVNEAMADAHSALVSNKKVQLTYKQRQIKAQAEAAAAERVRLRVAEEQRDARKAKQVSDLAALQELWDRCEAARVECYLADRNLYSWVRGGKLWASAVPAVLTGGVGFIGTVIAQRKAGAEASKQQQKLEALRSQYTVMYEVYAKEFPEYMQSCTLHK